MNLISTMVGLSIMGAAAPMMMDMSLAPFIAQKRAQNFGIAESAAVTFAAANEGAIQVGSVTDGCSLEGVNAPAYKITCPHGNKKFRQIVSRSFKLINPSTNNGGGNNNNSISFKTDPPPPQSLSHHKCPGGNHLPGWTADPWGTAYYNRDHLGGKHCIPVAAHGGIDPEDDMSTWKWDLRIHFDYKQI